MRAVRKLARTALRRIGLEPVNPARSTAPLYREDQAFHAAYERAKSQTGGTRVDSELRRHRYYTLVQLVRQSPLTQGDVCELGCFRGLSSYQIAATMVAERATSTLHLFDSFEGLSPRGEADGPEARVERQAHQQPASLETVRNSLREFPFIEFHPGWIPDRFRDVADRQFAFIHVDVVRYQPIHDSFMYFYPRLVEGGVMVFDDYGYTQFAGAKKAVDEGLARFGHPFFVTLPSGQAFVIKGARR